MLNSEGQKMAQNLEKSFVFKESINWKTSYTYKFPSGINSVIMFIIGGSQNQHNCLVFCVRVNEMLRYKKLGEADSVVITQSTDHADLIINAPVTLLIKIFESNK